MITSPEISDAIERIRYIASDWSSESEEWAMVAEKIEVIAAALAAKDRQIALLRSFKAPGGQTHGEMADEYQQALAAKDTEIKCLRDENERLRVVVLDARWLEDTR